VKDTKKAAVFSCRLRQSGVSQLILVRAQNFVWTWNLAILAGEFGQWRVMLPLGLAEVALWAASQGNLDRFSLIGSTTSGPKRSSSREDHRCMSI
jgi:hypothetical protein